MFFLERKTERQIAEKIRISQQAVNKIIAKYKTILRQYLLKVVVTDL